MSHPSVPVSELTLRRLNELAGWLGVSVPEALEQAVKELHKRRFWDVTNAAYAELRADPQAWAEEQAERRAWEATLMDGLDPNERWAADGTLQARPEEQPE